MTKHSRTSSGLSSNNLRKTPTAVMDFQKKKLQRVIRSKKHHHSIFVESVYIPVFSTHVIYLILHPVKNGNELSRGSLVVKPIKPKKKT